MRDWAILYQASESISEEGATTVRYWGQHEPVLILRVSLVPREILASETKAVCTAPSFGDAMKAEEMLLSECLKEHSALVSTLDRRETG